MHFSDAEGEDHCRCGSIREAVGYLERIADSLERLVDLSGPGDNWETRAILKIGEIGPIPARIAKAVGVSRRTLYNSPKFKTAINLARETKSGKAGDRRGHKGETFEAWQKENEFE